MSKMYITQLVFVALAVAVAIPLGIEVNGAMATEKIIILSAILGVCLFASYACGIFRLAKNKDNRNF